MFLIALYLLRLHELFYYLFLTKRITHLVLFLISCFNCLSKRGWFGVATLVLQGCLTQLFLLCWGRRG
jgi:hypothetical protein